MMFVFCSIVVGGAAVVAIAYLSIVAFRSAMRRRAMGLVATLLALLAVPVLTVLFPMPGRFIHRRTNLTAATGGMRGRFRSFRRSRCAWGPFLHSGVHWIPAVWLLGAGVWPRSARREPGSDRPHTEGRVPSLAADDVLIRLT